MSQDRKVVIVVGAGLAGMAAAIEAEKGGAHVYLIEKEARLGGNSAKASSGINGVNTAPQKAQNIPDTPEVFVHDTLESGHGLCEQNLVKILVDQSASAIEFLNSFGLELSTLSKCGGHTFPRTHRGKPGADGTIKNVGWEITSTLEKYIKSLPADRITIVSSAKLEDLIVKDNVVTGIQYVIGGETKTLEGSAVILATGGYAADREGLLLKYTPQIRHLPTTNGAWAQGEGVKIAEKIGAALTLMDQVQVHPTGFVHPNDPNNPTKFLAPEALRASGGILLNSKGERFVDELGLRDKVTKEIFAHCQKFSSPTFPEGPVSAYLLLNAKGVELFQAPALAFYKAKGFVKVYPNASAMASELNLPVDSVLKTFSDYADAASGKQPDHFGKKTFPITFTPDEELHVMIITPSIHYTMGGIKVDAQTRVIDTKGNIITGLYAAGEVSGGVHGGNRLAGNSLLECVVYGRIAGQQTVLNSNKL